MHKWENTAKASCQTEVKPTEAAPVSPVSVSSVGASCDTILSSGPSLAADNLRRPSLFLWPLRRRESEVIYATHPPWVCLSQVSVNVASSTAQTEVLLPSVLLQPCYHYSIQPLTFVSHVPSFIRKGMWLENQGRRTASYR